MGIVVSGEVGNMGVFREKQKTNAVIAENDYGLLMATLDQTLNFLGSWWTLSLGARIQVRSTPCELGICPDMDIDV